MRYPKHLPEGGTIGFLAPSFGCNIEPYKSAFQNAQAKFQTLGYNIKLGPNCYAGEGVGISNTPDKCGAEVNEMFADETSDVLISCGGGELMCEILPYVDFDLISKAEPKWYMGYSDNTNLTYLLTTLTDTASIYAPCAPAFGMEPWHASLEDAFGLLKGTVDSVQGYGKWEKESLKTEENPLVPYNVTEPTELKSYVGNKPIEAGEKIEFSGRLIGGCMDCLVTLLGTGFDKTADFLEKYKDDGFIWFLEACDLNVFSIRRAMWQMEQAGWFNYVKGFLIGRPLNGGEMFGLDAYQAILTVAGKMNVPVIMDVDLGHLPPMMPLVCGSAADICVQNNDIKMNYKFI